MANKRRKPTRFTFTDNPEKEILENVSRSEREYDNEYVDKLIDKISDFEGKIKKYEIDKKKTAIIIHDAMTQMNKMVEFISNNSKQQCEDILNNAKRQADEFVNSTKHECDLIINKAHEKSSVIISDANEKSSVIISDANKKSDEIISDANKKSSEIISNANEKSSEIINKSNENAKIISDKAITESEEILKQANTEKEKVVSEISKLDEKKDKIILDAEKQAYEIIKSSQQQAEENVKAAKETLQKIDEYKENVISLIKQQLALFTANDKENEEFEKITEQVKNIQPEDGLNFSEQIMDEIIDFDDSGEDISGLDQSAIVEEIEDFRTFVDSEQEGEFVFTPSVKEKEKKQSIVFEGDSNTDNSEQIEFVIENKTDDKKEQPVFIIDDKIPDKKEKAQFTGLENKKTENKRISKFEVHFDDEDEQEQDDTAGDN